MGKAEKQLESETTKRRARFQTTLWPLVLQAADVQSPERRRHLEELLRMYWKPVYAHIRLAWRKSSEDAKDLTQDFFLSLLEGEFFHHVSCVRARFRDFLKVSLDNFLRNQHRARKRLKRGGTAAVFSLDAREIDGVIKAKERSDLDPARLFDRLWAESLMQEAVRLLEEELIEEDKAAYFRVFQDRDLEASTRVSYRELAERHALSESTVRNYLAFARRRLREKIQDLLRPSVQSQEELEEELTLLFGGQP